MNSLLSRSLTLILILWGHHGFSQSHIWSTQTVRSNIYIQSPNENQISVDRKGNVNSIGLVHLNVDFDPGPSQNKYTVQGKTDVYVVQYDSNGQYNWGLGFGGTDFDYSGSIANDTAGNVYVAGSFIGTVDFNPGQGTTSLKSSGASDIFLAKFSSQGQFIWVKQIGGVGFGQIHDLLITNGGDVYAAGYYKGALDFDPSNKYKLLASTAEDIFLAKYDLNGNFQSVITRQEIGNQRINEITQGKSGKIFTIGYTGSTPQIRGFTTKGWTLFSKTFGGSKCKANAILAHKGSLYITGDFIGTGDFDPGSKTFNMTGGGARDAFLSKLDSDGDFIWAKKIGYSSSSWDYTAGHGLALGPEGELYMAGDAQFATDFDPGPGKAIKKTPTDFDIFIARYDTNGNYLTAFLPNAIQTGLGDMVSDGHGHIFISGHTYSWAYLDPNQYATRLPKKGNFFLAKYGKCMAPNFTGLSQRSVITCANKSPQITFKSNNSIGSAVWQLREDSCDGAMITRQNKDTISIRLARTTTLHIKPQGFCFPDTFQCDSIIIQVKPVARTTDTIAFCPNDSVLVNGTYFYSPGVVTDTFSANNLCDSIHTTTLILNPTYLDTVDVSLCNGDSLLIGSNYANATGVYWDSLKSQTGCDSVKIFRVTVYPSYSSQVHHEICQGDSVFIIDRYETNNLVRYDSSVTINGCDSITKYSVDVWNTTLNSQKISICSTDSTFVNGRYLSVPGIYSDTLKNTRGCDSVMKTTIDHYPLLIDSQVVSICEYDSFPLFNRYASNTGIYIDTTSYLSGCDSAIMITELEHIVVDTTLVYVKSDTQLIAKAKSANFQWINCSTDMVIPGATDSVYKAVNSGYYAVAIAQNSCNDTSRCVEIDLVNSVLRPRNEVSVFPNPAYNTVTIIIEDPKASQTVLLELTDMRGQLVASKLSATSDGTINLNIQHLNPGFYLLNARSKSFSYQTKVLVAH